MKKSLLVPFILAAVLFLSLGLFTPWRLEEVCLTKLDCGFDVGGTDIMDVKKWGYPFAFKKTEITRTYGRVDFAKVATTSRTTINKPAIILDALFWFVISFLIIFILKAIKRIRRR